MNMQQTSLLAWNDIQGNLGERQRQVYAALLNIREGTNNMISKASGLPINVVTPRIFELREKGLVVESYKDLCPITKRRAIFWRIR